MKQPQRMTRKDALNILYDMRDAYMGVLIRSAHGREQGYEEWEHASDETWQALMKVTEAVYGPAHYPQCGFPCDVCRHRYAEHDVQEKGKVGKTWCCTPCLARVRVERELTDIDGEPVKQEEQPAFEPVNSHEHDDRCLCPGCSGLCQDDHEFYSGTGQYAQPEGQA